MGFIFSQLLLNKYYFENQNQHELFGSKSLHKVCITVFFSETFSNESCFRSPQGSLTGKHCSEK